MNEDLTKLQKELFLMQDMGYRDFHKKLIPCTDPDTIIGVRTPELRKFAKSFAKTKEAEEFLNRLPHRFYEENNLHAFVIEQIKDFEEALLKTEKFLPYIDNWATCDMFLPKTFVKNSDRLLKSVLKWIKSEHTYTVRYAIGLLMSVYSGENFKIEYMDTVANIRSREYYINMMIAWYFATELAKRYDIAKVYLTEHRLDAWVHNKAIQKAIESRRINSAQKEELRRLKIKGERA